jgi:hypothetical protein
MPRSLDEIVAFVGSFPMGVRSAQVAEFTCTQRETVMLRLRRLRLERRVVRVGFGPRVRWATPETATATIAWFKATLKPPDTSTPKRPQQSDFPVRRVVRATDAKPLNPGGPAWVFDLGKDA